MSKLWVFGDSFAENCMNGRTHVIEQQWHRMLSRELGFNMENFGLAGTALDYTYDYWYRKKDLIVSGDIVVIAVTELSRRWIFANYPQYSNLIHLFTGVYDDYVPYNTKLAKKYHRSFNHECASVSKFYNWLCALEKKATEGVRILLLPNFYDCRDLLWSWKTQFNNLNIAKGCLGTINNQEHVESLWIDGVVLIEQDGRCNRMSPPNHKVLTSKIMDWVQNGTEVDLDEGFHRDLIKQNDYDDEVLFVRPHKVRTQLYRWI